MIYLNAVSVALATSASSTRWFSTTGTGSTLYGTATADYLSSADPTATLVGGLGDDTYVIGDARTTVVEAAGGGVDTVVSWAAREVLSSFVENLQLAQGGELGIGNALDNIILASSGSDTLDGGTGNDVLVGGAGADAFIVSRGNGSDAIVNFTPGVDTIRLQGYGLYDFAAFKAAVRQTGADTTIALGNGETLVLRNVQAGSLTARDVWLPADPAHFGMTRTFDEEFNSFSASASGLGTTWKTSLNINEQLRTMGGNHEAEYYSDSSVGVNPFTLTNGVLDITAAPGGNPAGLAYNSGIITTAKSFAQLYGYFEARLELPAGQGFWPAFWLLPTDNTWPPEIDVFEVLGNAMTTAYGSVHSTVAGDTTFSERNLPDLSAGFHVFGLSWQADRIKWYVDGNEVAEVATPADMNKPMYMLLNLAVGDTGSWPGKYDPTMPTGHMLIDYVRAWQTAPSVVTGPGDVAAAGGIYTLKADGVSDLYDFSKSALHLTMDASGLGTAGTHTVYAGPAGSDVRGGPGTVNFAGGAGVDTFTFGSGTSRAMGGAGNDVFVMASGSIAAGNQIIDFHVNLGDGTEHDMLRLTGFSAAAHFDYVSSSGTVQYYHVVDGAQVSPLIGIQVANGTGHLGPLDYQFG